MNSKEALRKLYFDNEDLKVDITLNDNKVCEIHNIIRDDLDKLEDLKKVVKILKKKFNIINVRPYNDIYVINTDLFYVNITQEEYDLLKEYLDE